MSHLQRPASAQHLLTGAETMPFSRTLDKGRLPNSHSYGVQCWKTPDEATFMVPIHHSPPCQCFCSSCFVCSL
ncbi:hypothetical protein Y1Q_0019987 [Alligator mississippiensis]|uniref:Uncharacterized protein n=1 Tax=Alligator mississippiensis TaxID=8496 RepID=A0A151PE54_ALLMI|nr:hypothetical protein Y1Q_0019987 [Alligator mississippiensis]